jgi:hypothetical protein
MSKAVECHEKIVNGLKNFVVLGLALREMRDNKYYKEFGFKTFEAYCKQKHEISRSYAHRQIQASESVENVANWQQNTPSPKVEAQAREIAKVEPEKQAEIWVAVQEETGKDQPTAKEIKDFIIEDKKKENKANVNPDPVTKAFLFNESYEQFAYRFENNSVDLLFTDPPYSTDIDNIQEFAENWLGLFLPKIKDSGRAFICIGAYPIEINAYMNILLKQDRFIVDNPLIWTYKNTLGQTPNMKYNLNYQMILHLYSKDSKPLDKSITGEMFSVMEINAPDGRQGNRLHTWQKPDELAERLIRHSTNEGDIIIDPFACTGTFCLMAAKMNRETAGCDISAENLEIAKGRGCNVV